MKSMENESTESLKGEINPLSQEVMKQIKEHRVMKGISQKSLAKRSNVTQNIISRSENGLWIPTFPTILKLLDALDLEAVVVLQAKNTNADKDKEVVG